MPHPALGKSFLAAASALLALPSLNAGIMDPAIGVQTYRDFAENRGIFAADATNVQIYNTSGVYVGTIERMMNFDSVVDGGWSSLAGGPSFIATVAHNNSTNVSFTGRFGATGVFADSYHFVAYNRGWGAETNYTYDYATPRLNKIVTEAQATPYLTDTSILNNIVGRTVFRVGGGTQTLATGYGSETGVTGAYAYLTGGTIDVTLEQCRIPSGTIPADANGTDYQSQTINPTHPASYYNSYSFFAPNRPSDADEPLDIGIYARPDYYFGSDDPVMRALMKGVDATADPAEQNELYRAAQERVARRFVNAFLFQLAKTGVADARIEGLWVDMPTQANDMTHVRWTE